MHVVKKAEVKTRKNSPTCIVQEYPSPDKDINLAVVELSGRYPTSGWAVNEKCKEMGWVLKGSGQFVTENQIVTISEGDLVVVEPGENYFWDGHMTLVMPATPAWYFEQHKNIDAK